MLRPTLAIRDTAKGEFPRQDRVCIPRKRLPSLKRKTYVQAGVSSLRSLQQVARKQALARDKRLQKQQLRVFQRSGQPGRRPLTSIPLTYVKGNRRFRIVTTEYFKRRRKDLEDHLGLTIPVVRRPKRARVTRRISSPPLSLPSDRVLHTHSPLTDTEFFLLELLNLSTYLLLT